MDAQLWFIVIEESGLQYVYKMDKIVYEVSD
jgi:hypothetical protein